MGDIDLDALIKRMADKIDAEHPDLVAKVSVTDGSQSSRLICVSVSEAEAIIAALEERERDMGNFGDQIAAAHDMARFHRERAERLRDVARKVCEAMDLPAVPGDTSAWVRIPGADILALEAALEEKSNG
jgi:DICT domain-containing protein